jgi:hypothetical protein
VPTAHASAAFARPHMGDLRSNAARYAIDELCRAQVQSASAKALHQPSLLISPVTTLQAFGGSNNVHVAQL